MVDQPSNTIASFRGLHSNRERAQFLHDLISELSPYECRGLKEILNQETYQIDIISFLPLELVHIVLQHLDALELFSLRRVSRSWLHRLASQDVCRTILRRDFPEETMRVDSNDLDPTTRLFSKVQHRHAFRTGRPYSKATYPFKLSFDHMWPASRTQHRLIDYHDGMLVSIDIGSGTAIARTLNLRNGRYFSIVPRNRENISQVKISDALVVVITSLGVCHVYDDRTEESHFFHLPSLPPVPISVAARHIAVVVLPADSGFASVVLRNCDTRKSSNLNIVLDSDSYTRAVVLHPRGDAFYLFTTGPTYNLYDEETGYWNGRIEVQKFNFQGEMMFKRECWVRLNLIMDRSIRFNPTVNGSHCFIALGARYRASCGDYSSIVQDHYIHYDMESEEVSYEKSARKVCEPDPVSDQPACRGPIRQNMRWKDMTYFAWYSRRRFKAIMVQSVNDLSSARMTETLDIDPDANAGKRVAWIMRHGDDVADYGLVGDERFLVLIDFDEVQVWCFEKDLVMPSEDPDYRVERMRRADVRAAKRRLHAMET